MKHLASATLPVIPSTGDEETRERRIADMLRCLDDAERRQRPVGSNGADIYFPGRADLAEEEPPCKVYDRCTEEIKRRIPTQDRQGTTPGERRGTRETGGRYQPRSGRKRR